MIELLALNPSWWQETFLIKVPIGLLAVLLPAGTIVYLYLFKAISFMQSRLGPMEAGPYGSLQLLAEVGKWLQKEDIFPSKADKFVFAAAPFVVLMSTFLLVVVLPAGPDALFVDLDAGNLSCDGSVISFSNRNLDGRLVLSKQIFSSRWNPCRRPTHCL